VVSPRTQPTLFNSSLVRNVAPPFGSDPASRIKTKTGLMPVFVLIGGTD